MQITNFFHFTTQENRYIFMKALCIAGGVPHIELIKQLKARGFTTILLDGNGACLARPYADVFYQVNIFDTDAVKKIALDEKADLIITVCADQVLLVVTKLSEELGLPCYVGYETSCKASDKIEMKRMFRRTGIPSSAFAELDELDFDKIASLRYPLIVKPVDAYSSRGVRKVLNREELVVFFDEAKKISRNGRVIVEEFNVGEEISVDAFVVNGKAQVLMISQSDKIRDDNRFVIFRGKYPTDHEEEIIGDVQVICQKIADELKLVNSPLLVQMIRTDRGVSVLEYCTRTGGNMKWLLIKYKSGVDVITATIDASLGITPVIEVKEPRYKYVVNDFVYCSAGILDHLEGFDGMLEEDVIKEYRQVRLKGHTFTEIRSSGDRAVGFTITADTFEELNEKQRRVNQSVKVIDSLGKDIMRHDLLPDFH